MTNEHTHQGQRIMVIQARWTVFLALFAGTAISSAAATEWQLVEDSSNVRFVGIQEGSAFRGRFQNFSAMIDFDPENPTAGKIVGVVKMDSAESGDAERDATLLEEDWFDPENYPDSRFESERIEQLDDGTFAAHGQLTLVGISQPVTMVFEFETADSTAHFSGRFEIKRLEFGVGWEATNWIADEVAVQVDLDLQQ
jgi:polyisoprenoid-binding protein YceI